ncbi:hypothetical protein LBMAG50_01850 [Phycisphaerae bacterium]|nr:hypothetical protein LBMAG50_01850 [Phycisphaerae bacterium]
MKLQLSKYSIGNVMALITLACATIVCANTLGCTSKGMKGGSVLPTKYRSISVPVFDNATPDREMGFQLTEALQKRLQQTTPYTVTHDGRADTILRGKVISVKLNQLSQSVATGLSEEVAYTVTLDWDWVDVRTGKSITARKGFSASGVVVTSRSQAEPLDLARFEVTQRLADDIVANLQADW